MELIEIKGFFKIDYGAPSPIIISNDDEIFMSFYVYDDFSSQEMKKIGSSIVLTFPGCLKYKFGVPGSETTHGHPYAKLGMTSAGFYELKNSDLIKELQDIDKVHPDYDERRWDAYKHYILTFHDNMFECVAREFTIIQNDVAFREQATLMLQSLSERK